MKFVADLHVHSKYSRATAKNLDLEHLYIASALKGISLVGTGDFTHPAWSQELKEKLVPAEPGLFRLKPDIEKACDKEIPDSCKGNIRFILQCEISSIYKKNGRTRKNHNLVFAPDLKTVSAINSRLDSIGNIKSDGRPILGLDAKILLEIILEISPDAFLVPAHIWTPWFSLLGSKSGFDSIEECFEDLTEEIFAAETGLSSDPPMNWRISGLDNITLISNSDAHSPMNLGRNANIFDVEYSFDGILSALKTGDPGKCLGTLDMYPEEGKYHYDGHRKCNICFKPSQSHEHENICPECSKALTIGVLNRVDELADRPEGCIPESGRILPCSHIIPLAEILSEILDVGPKSKKVNVHYQSAINQLGPEIDILHSVEIKTIKDAGIFLLDEAIDRMRKGKIHIFPGYDGEYGKIRLFDPEEKTRLAGQQALFAMPSENPSVPKNSIPQQRKSTVQKKSDRLLNKDKNSEKAGKSGSKSKKEQIAVSKNSLDDLINELNTEQKNAVEHPDQPLLIMAGPGTGKTRTLTCKIAFLMEKKGVSPDNILALTFTNKAAREMEQRLKSMIDPSQFKLKPKQKLPYAATFHSLCFDILKEQGLSSFNIIDEEDQKDCLAETLDRLKEAGVDPGVKPDIIADLIALAKQNLLSPNVPLDTIIAHSKVNAKIFAQVYEAYQNLLEGSRFLDFEDLNFKVVRLFISDPDILALYENRFKYIFIDEYQDLNYAQYKLVRLLAPDKKAICVIGDPNQAIYGFRGADVRYFARFADDYPACGKIHLKKNYRSTETIIEASHQVIKKQVCNVQKERIYSGIKGSFATLTILETLSAKAEAVAVGKMIEAMTGGMGFDFHDFDKDDFDKDDFDKDDFDKAYGAGLEEDRSFSDFAVLFRTNAQGRVISDVFESAGIPCQLANREDVWTQEPVAQLIAVLKIAEDRGRFKDLEIIARLKGFGISGKNMRAQKEWFAGRKEPFLSLLSLSKEAGQTSMKRIVFLKWKSFVDNIFLIKDVIKQDKSVEEKLGHILSVLPIASGTDKDAKTSNSLNMVMETANGAGTKIDDFFARIALQKDSDFLDSAVEKVSLMSMHAAKGLEFPVVFVTGCETGFMPYERAGRGIADMDEERRLFYVAMTRAKERLLLSWAKKRVIFGKLMEKEISPFVADIEKRLISRKRSDAKQKKSQKENQVQLGLFN